MRPVRILVALILLALAGPAMAPSHPALVPVPDAVFVDRDGPHPAFFSWSGPCNGFGTVELTILRGPGHEHRSVPGRSTMAPDVCLIECLDCPLPFAWVLDGQGVEPVLVAGGGLAGSSPAWSVQGPFHEGLLEASGTPFVFAS